jgi:hypothetical protein
VKVRPRKSDAPWNKTNLTRFWTCPDRNSHCRRPRRSRSRLRRVCWPLNMRKQIAPTRFRRRCVPDARNRISDAIPCPEQERTQLTLMRFWARASPTHLLASPTLFAALGAKRGQLPFLRPWRLDVQTLKSCVPDAILLLPSQNFREQIFSFSIFFKHFKNKYSSNTFNLVYFYSTLDS